MMDWPFSFWGWGWGLGVGLVLREIKLWWASGYGGTLLNIVFMAVVIWSKFRY